MAASNEFEIRENDSMTVSGKVRIPTERVLDPQLHAAVEAERMDQYDHIRLAAEDIYKELRLRGYDYSGDFQGIHSSDNLGN